MNKTITCINCPVGCRMTVTLNDEGEVLSVSGNTCPAVQNMPGRNARCRCGC